jgi:ATP-dependent DNA ligase
VRNGLRGGPNEIAPRLVLNDSLLLPNRYVSRDYDVGRPCLSLQAKTLLDGEIVCLDKRGKPQFRDLLFHRGEPCFFAFDLVMSDGKDLRTEKLTDRKQELRHLLSKGSASRMRYADHMEHYGTALFQRVCKIDLEGIVAKHSLARHTTERTTWFKSKNHNYSQVAGREELFERERHQAR